MGSGVSMLVLLPTDPLACLRVVVPVPVPFGFIDLFFLSCFAVRAAAASLISLSGDGAANFRFFLAGGALSCSSLCESGSCSSLCESGRQGDADKITGQITGR